MKDGTRKVLEHVLQFLVFPVEKYVVVFLRFSFNKLLDENYPFSCSSTSTQLTLKGLRPQVFQFQSGDIGHFIAITITVPFYTQAFDDLMNT